MRRVHEITVAVEKQVVLHIFARSCVRARWRSRMCVCGCTGTGVYLRASSLIYPACNVSRYCILQRLLFHQIFRHYLINGMIFRKKSY